MEWKEVRLGDILNFHRGHDLPREKMEFGEVPVAASNGIIGYHNVATDISPCITIGRSGNIGTPYIYKKCWAHNTTLYIDNFKGNDPLYLYYLCKTIPFKSFVGGSAVPTLNRNHIHPIMVKYIPNLSDQRKIAGILSALDSKIENNNKINANLEAQAEALFKSWFVDFTPFKDQPFVDSELGPIPQGWKVGKLGDICTFKRGKNLLSKNAIDEGVPVVAGGLSPSCYHNQANTSAPVVTVSGSGANAGFMRMYHVDVWASDCSFIDVSCDYLYFVYCFLSVNRRLLKHAQTGAVQPHVKPADIHDFDVVIPEEDIVKAFQSIIKELLTKVGVNEKENQRLAALRDTLLPKLMSGEIKL